jgi:formylglycine-generating enzyme required for sulfatase activity
VVVRAVVASLVVVLALAALAVGCDAASTAVAPSDLDDADAGAETGEPDATDAIAEAMDAESDAADATRADGALRDCPADTVTIDGFCMDRYEAPNQAGAKPLAFQTAPDGVKWCAARGRRLCTEAEWVRACNGTSKRPYPYGTTYAKGTCDDDKTWISPNWTTLGAYPSDAALAEAQRLYQADPSGLRAKCVSEEGALDLTGNVAEWVVRSFPNANNYDHVMKGCYWAGCYGGSPPSCGFVNPAHPGTFRTYEAGFRCCMDR